MIILEIVDLLINILKGLPLCTRLPIYSVENY